jgi:hypothetical protein
MVQPCIHRYKVVGSCQGDPIIQLPGFWLF